MCTHARTHARTHLWGGMLGQVAREMSGLRVVVKGSCRRSVQADAAIELTSSFLFRGANTSSVAEFKKTQDERLLHIKTAETLAVLLSKKWTKWDGYTPGLGDWLVFRTTRLTQRAAGEKTQDMSAEGSILRIDARSAGAAANTFDGAKPVGQVAFHAGNARGDVIEAFMLRHTRPLREPKFFESGGYRMARIDKVLCPRAITI